MIQAGGAIGVRPNEIRAMSLCDWGDVLEGWAMANSPNHGADDDAMSVETFRDLKSRYPDE